jgi:hypothetical protein
MKLREAEPSSGDKPLRITWSCRDWCGRSREAGSCLLLGIGLAVGAGEGMQ